ncbi:AAA family ATPase [Ensifer adhaerens]|uniref:AAA family ATPase n=1 Tax=Ensifer adhaerens TaxID=106592 RepID=UPI0009EA5754|nr:ATP-binding protein [Ensifer adhaerens]
MSTTPGFTKLRIRGWRQFQDIELQLHPRLTIITGANGAGKSTLLSFFSRHFGYHRAFLATPQRSGAKRPFSVGLFVLRKLGLAPTPPLPTSPHGIEIGEIGYSDGTVCKINVPTQAALHYDVAFDRQLTVDGIHIDSHRPPNVYRHVANYPSAPPVRQSIGLGVDSEYINFYQGGGLNSGSLYHIKMTLMQLSIFGYGNETMDPMPELIELFKGFEAVLKVMLPKSLGFEKLIIRPPEVLLSTKSGDFLVDAASGGIIKLFEVAWQLYFYSQGRERFVVTLDEPENHLHPSMQKSFLPSILEAFPGLQVIAVTHSPFIISAMQDSAVYVLRYLDADIAAGADDDQSIRGLLGTRVVAERLDTVNKAASASEILRDVLGIASTIPDWAEARVQQIVGQFKGTRLDEAALKNIYAQLEREGLASSYPSALTSLTRSN